MKRIRGKNADVRTVRLIYFLWFSLIFASFLFQLYQETRQTRSLAIQQAYAMFLKDRAFRHWAASHGGVYVPVTEITQPNPGLADIPDRDITTPSGKKLTLMNPAFMLRQMMDQFEEDYGIKGHITSLKNSIPETAPDEWEKQALKRLENGEEKIMEFVIYKDEPALRLMGGMKTEKSCLKCHQKQGYHEGDLRGGVSLTMPLNHFKQESSRMVMILLFAHGLLGAIGFLFIYLYIQKIQKAKKIEDQFLGALEQWGNLFEFSSWGIGVLDPANHTIILANPALFLMHGYNNKHLEGFNILVLFPDEEANRIRNQLDRMFLTKNTQLESIQRRADGSTFPSIIDLNLVENSNKPVYVINIRDISTVKRQEELLEQNRNYLRSILDAQKNIIVVNQKGRIIDANQAFFNFFNEFRDLAHFRSEHDCICDLFVKTDSEGYVYNGMEGKSWIEILEEKKESITRVMVRRDSSIYHFAVSYQKVNHYDDNQYIVVLTDITELMVYRERLEERVAEESEKRRQHEEKFLEQFRLAQMGSLLENIAHHWRQPLNNVGLLIQNLEMETQDGGTISSERFQETGDQILKIITRLSRNIEDVLNLEIRPGSSSHFNIIDSLHQTVELYQPSLQGSGIEIQWGNLEPGEIPGDSRYLIETLVILLSNSIDAVQSIQRARSNITIETTGIESGLVLTLQDEGGGIPEEILLRIYEPFFTTKGKTNRTGLGLYFAKKYIERDLSGRINIENLERGVCVSIILPVVSSPPPAPST